MFDLMLFKEVKRAIKKLQNQNEILIKIISDLQLENDILKGMLEFPLNNGRTYVKKEE